MTRVTELYYDRLTEQKILLHVQYILLLTLLDVLKFKMFYQENNLKIKMINIFMIFHNIASKWEKNSWNIFFVIDTNVL